MNGADLVLTVVDGNSNAAHFVHVDVAALHRISGRYPALCGVEVCSASLTAAPAQACRDCLLRAGRGRRGTAQ